MEQRKAEHKGSRNGESYPQSTMNNLLNQDAQVHVARLAKLLEHA